MYSRLYMCVNVEKKNKEKKFRRILYWFDFFFLVCVYLFCLDFVEHVTARVQTVRKEFSMPTFFCSCECGYLDSRRR